MHGLPVALIGNNGPIDNDGATKISHFIQHCCHVGTPIIFLQNTTGYMVGRAYERGGMIKNGSKMIQAVSTATVPRFTFMIGASFGAGNFGMCGRGYAPHFQGAWPNARIGLMGPEQAGLTMRTVADSGARRQGLEADEARLEKIQRDVAALIEDTPMTDILADARASVLFLTLNNPERRNALSDAVLDRFLELTEQPPEGLRAVVIRGAGGIFCAGGDIKQFRTDLQEKSPAEIAAYNRRYGEILRRLDELPLPVIAAVEGAAMGGYSSEVENAVASHPGVANCAAIGIPDADWGERVHAVVVLKSGVTLDGEQIREHCKTRIAGYKAPRPVEFVDHGRGKNP